MREIRFRGKRKDNGEWVYGYYGLKEASDQHFIMVETMNSHHDWTYFTDYVVDPKTVGQYTGLKDKNKKEVYEGDIVKANLRFFDIVDQKCRVIFHNGSFGLQYGYSLDYFKPLAIWDDIEVIGNIYENPELLKGEENA